MNTRVPETDGYIYCLSNESFTNDLYKIGFTTRTPDERIDELYHTGTPLPFKIEFAKKVCNPFCKEQKIHKMLEKYRVNPSREFFKVPLDIIYDIFNLLDGIWYDIQIPVMPNPDDYNLWIEKRHKEIIPKPEPDTCELSRRMKCHIKQQKLDARWNKIVLKFTS